MDRKPGSAHPASAFIFERSTPTPESYRFAQGDKPVEIAAVDGAKARTFSGVAYSGEAIENHWYWGRVVFDLSTTKAPAKLPMLMGHDRDSIAGFANKIEITDKIVNSGVLSSKTDFGKQVADLSDEGFPWQQSVHIEPSRIEEVQAGKTVTVNGRQFSGPIVVFRDNTLREISFTPTGWDPNTSATAMSRATHHASDQGVEMDPKELEALQAKAAQADQFAADAKTAKDALEAEKAARIAAETKAQAFEKEKTDAARAARDEKVKALFAKTGTEFKDETAKPYREMSDEQFSAVAAQLEQVAKVSGADSSLFSETAKSGPSAGGDAQVIAEQATALQASLEAKGVHIDIADAVRRVRAGATA